MTNALPYSVSGLLVLLQLDASANRTAHTGTSKMGPKCLKDHVGRVHKIREHPDLGGTRMDH